MLDYGGEGGQRPLPWKKEGKGAEVPLSSCLMINNFLQFLLAFVLLSILLKNGEFHEVSDRQSNEVL